MLLIACTLGEKGKDYLAQIKDRKATLFSLVGETLLR